MSYRGRRSGRAVQLVTQYVRDGDVVWILVGAPGSKTWWKNFRERQPVVLRLAGREEHGSAVALDGAEVPDDVAGGLGVYLARLPRAAKALGAPAATAASLRQLAAGAVMVRVDLERRAG